MQITDRLTVSKDVVAREVGGEMVLLDLSSGQYFGLDSVGARFWELLSEGTDDFPALCDGIEKDFDAPRDRIEHDLLALLEQLREQGLVTTG